MARIRQCLATSLDPTSDRLEHKHDHFTPSPRWICGWRNVDFRNTRDCASAEQNLEISGRLSGCPQGKPELRRLHTFSRAIGVQIRRQSDLGNRLVPPVSRNLSLRSTRGACCHYSSNVEFSSALDAPMTNARRLEISTDTGGAGPRTQAHKIFFISKKGVISGV